MSASTQENTARRNRTAPPASDTPAADAANGATSLGFNTIEINATEVSVPVMFAPGHVLTENQAKVIQAAYERQFTNNQNALAKSRVEGKNTTAQPDAAKLAEMFLTYEPSVGGTTRQSTMDKLRHEAAWRHWVSLEALHNEAVKAFLAGATDTKPVIAKGVDANGKLRMVNLRFAAVKADPEKGTVATSAEEQRQSFTTRLLDTPEYAAGIQATLDTILAERGTKKAEVETAAIKSAEDVI